MPICLWMHLQFVTHFDHTRFGSNTQRDDLAAFEAGFRIPITPSQKRRFSGVKLGYRYLMPLGEKSKTTSSAERQIILTVEETTRHGISPSHLGVGFIGNGKEKQRYFFFAVAYGLSLPVSVKTWF